MENNTSSSSSTQGWLKPIIVIWVIFFFVAIIAGKEIGLLLFLTGLLVVMLYKRNKHKVIINKQIFEKKSADFKKAFKQALSADKKYKAIKFSLIALLGFIIVGAVLLPDNDKKIKEQSEKEKIAEKQVAAKDKTDSAQETKPVKKGYGTSVIVNLKRAGPTSAEVEFEGQYITVRKYYPGTGDMMGASTDLSLLVPCIGYQVLALIERGAIFGLYCPDKTNKDLGESLREGNIEGTVLVVPDEYINVR